jgi:hypothetical protein
LNEQGTPGVPSSEGNQMSETATPVAPAAAAAEAPAAPKVKTKKLRQRACDEKDEKSKICCGHLKRWYDYPPEIAALIGKKAEIYRCEFCKTLYKPDLNELPRSFTLRF